MSGHLSSPATNPRRRAGRSGWAVLAAGTLVASLFAVGAAPAVAQPGSTITPAIPNYNPDFGAHWSACVGAADSHDAKFNDVGGHTHVDAINCIAYYGITLGKGDGSFAPDENVSAFQMRLFVKRAADLMGADGEAVLADVELSDTVTRLEMAKLMFGLVDDIDDDVRIDPSDSQIKFWDKDLQPPNWRVVDDYFADVKLLETIAESQLVGATYELGITRGTRGDGTLVSTPDSTFEPGNPVTRAQMASFITRMLDHSNLRPEGLSLQRNKDKDTMASLRDAGFAPIENAYIDVFSALYPDDAFDANDGECKIRFVKGEAPNYHNSVCEIDIYDELTDGEGNLELTLESDDDDPIKVSCDADTGTGSLSLSTAGGSSGRTFWAWTGDRGDEVDESTTLVRLEDVSRPVGAAGPSSLRVSGGLLTDDELAKMGETVTFTAQLQSQDAAVGPDRSRNPYQLKTEKFYVQRDTWDHDNNTSTPVVPKDSDYGDNETKMGTASTSGTNSFANAPGDWNFIGPDKSATTAGNESPFQTPVDRVVFPNNTGHFTIDLTHPDPNDTRDNTDVGVRFTVTPFTEGNGVIASNPLTAVDASGNHAAQASNPAGGTRAIGYAIFSDEDSDPHKVTGESAAAYRLGSTVNSMTVKVVDQYGDPMPNVAISVASSLDKADPDADEVTYPEEVDKTVQAGETDADGNPGDLAPSDPIDIDGTESPMRHLRTRRNGTHRISYTYTGTSAQTETITPRSIQVLRVHDQEVGEDVKVYWAKVGNSTESHTASGGALEPVPVLMSDVASRTILVNEAIAEPDSDNPMAYFYDEGDTFNVAGVGASIEMFEEALKATYKSNKIWAHLVKWDNYHSIARPGRTNRTIWTLGLSCANPADLELNPAGTGWQTRTN